MSAQGGARPPTASNRSAASEVLSGKTAVVTGGGGGIGAALAAELSSSGMRVVVADIDVEAAGRVADSLVRTGAAAIAARVDVTDPGSVAELARASYDEFGSVELLCNNAGVLLFGSLIDGRPEDWRWLSSVNVEGSINCVRAFVPRMRRQSGWRHVANTASTHAFISGGGLTSLYSATKHALFALTISLREELEAEGIGVTAICPGQVASRILDAQRNRPPELGEPAAEPFGTGVIPGGIEPVDVATRAVAGIVANAPVVFALGDPSGFRGQVEHYWRLADAALAETAPSAIQG